MNDFREYIGVDYTPYLMHYGRSVVDGAPGRGSGRYPRGSGENPRAAIKDNPIARMSKKNYTDANPEYINLRDTHPIEKLEDLTKASLFKNKKQLRKSINSPYERGRTYNCPNCSAAFELIERGYDVKARIKGEGSNVEDITRFFKGGKLEKVTNDKPLAYWKKACAYGRKASEIEDKWIESRDPLLSDPLHKEAERLFDKMLDAYTLRNEETKIQLLNSCKAKGDKTRGIIVVGWQTQYSDDDLDDRTTLFHAFSYKVEKGQTKFYDCQSHREDKQNGSVNIDYVLEKADPRDIYIMRTDNLELDPSIMQAVYSNGRKK